MKTAESHRNPPRPLWASPAGKSRMAKQLARLLPEHTTYVEPFAGSAAVLFAKPPSATEVVSDVEPAIVEAFRAAQRLTDDDVESLRAANWTGSKEVFKTLQGASDDSPDDAERLRRFLYLSHFSFLKRRRHFSPALAGIPAAVGKRLAPGVARLRQVVVQGGDYEAVVRKYDGPETAFFFDPPYVGSDGGVGEKGFDETRFFDLLRGLQGKFLVTYGSGGTLVSKCRAAGLCVQQHFVKRNAPVASGATGRPSLATFIIANYALPPLHEAAAQPFAKSVAILKQVPEERYLLGVVLEPDVVDAHDDIYGVDEVRRAAHGFMAQHRTLGLMHRWQINDAVTILESYLLPADADIGGARVRQGTWMLGVRIEDAALWQQVRCGELTGFSIGGTACRAPLDASLSTEAA